MLLPQLGHNSGERTIFSYALEIREVLKEHSAVEKEQTSRKVRVGILLREVKEKFFPEALIKNCKGISVKRRQNATKDFKNWCTENIISESGNPYSYKTIVNCMMLCINPEKDKQDKARWQRASHADARKYRRLLKNFPAAEILALRSSLPIHDQVNFLASAWERTTEEARREFMNLTGLRFI